MDGEGQEAGHQGQRPRLEEGWHGHSPHLGPPSSRDIPEPSQDPQICARPPDLTHYVFVLRVLYLCHFISPYHGLFTEQRVGAQQTHASPRG